MLFAFRKPRVFWLELHLGIPQFDSVVNLAPVFEEFSSLLKYIHGNQVEVMHPFSPSTWEAEAGRSQ